MKIQYCSDLHLEFPENKSFFRENPLHKTGDILILGGDIIPFSEIDKHSEFFDFLSDRYQSVYWIPGNHEYYGSDITDRSGILSEKIRNNISLINNFTKIEAGIKFIFSTLWSHISPANEYVISQSISDFDAIKFCGNRLTTAHINELHKTAKEFIMQELQKKDNKQTIIVSHHVPTMLNYPLHYKGSLLNDAFAVELYDLIADTQPNYWIYGHHHTNTPSFKIGRTEMLTNQLGYVQSGEHLNFDRGAYIEVRE